MKSSLDLLEPGRLLGGALFTDLLARSGQHIAPRTRVGPFSIVRELGRGGMGSVYLAERVDGEFEQEVALKFLGNASSSISEDMLRRERQTLAGLRHPGITRLLDGGHDELGRPWLAMERIEGLTLDVHCLEKALPLAQRLRLFLDVCAAVSFAHSRGVLHRDLKPSNVMVDQDGRAKLLDFGIAQLGEQDQFGASAYTPGFASPEQLQGAPTAVTSDIFQLGKLLTALLSTSQSEHQTRLQSAAQRIEIELPKHLPEDVRRIIAKATAPRAESRYQTAAELAQDVGAFLANKPINARRSESLYVFRKFLGRHRFAAAIVSVTAVVIVAGITYSMIRITKERDRAEESAAQSGAMADFLSTDILAQGDPIYGAGADTRLLDVLQDASDKVAQRFAQQPTIAAKLHLNIGNSMLGLGDQISAEKSFAASADALQRAQVPPGDDAWIWLYYTRGDAQLRLAEFSKAQVFLLKARAGADLSNQPANTDYLWIDTDLAWINFELGDMQSSREQMTAIAARWQRGSPRDELGYRYVRHLLAVNLTELGEFAAAKKSFQEIETELLHEVGDQHPALAQLYRNYGSMLRASGDLSASRSVLEKAHAIVTTRLSVDHIDRHAVDIEYGITLWQSGARAEGLAMLENAALARQRILGLSHNRARGGLLSLARDYRESGRAHDSLAVLTDVCPATEKSFGSAHEQYWRCQHELAMTLAALGRTSEAIALAQPLIAKIESLPLGHIRRARALSELQALVQP
jgi:eukaryotic-like serine/threonine-protein kinase